MLHPLLWCYCVLVVQAIEHYENPQMLKELNSTKSDKLWFASVRIPLASAMNVSSIHTMDSWYCMLWRRAQLITKWCQPNNINTTQQGHSKLPRLWNPCGDVTIILGIRTPPRLVYLIWTYRLLVVQIYFRLFEMDASNTRCVDSSILLICQNKIYWDCPLKWRYCGYHQPWLVTTSSHKVAAMLEQLNVRSSCNISFTYTSIDMNIAGIYNKYDQRTLISGELPQTGVILDRNNIKAYNNLVIVTKIGFKFHLNSIKTCCFSGHIKMYAGDRNYHLVFHKKVTTQVVEEPLNIIVNYYLLSVEQYADKIHFSNTSDTYFILRYTLRFIDWQSLRIGEVTTLNNAGGLLYKGYHIRYNDVKFPNVSFTIRKFEGWNDNYCHFGGYMWKNKIMTGTAHEANNELGPFCSKSLPSHPFVGNIGPKYIVLGSFDYYLIFYAYGPLYNIDIDIHIHPSDCEGLFEPQSMCFTSQDMTAPKLNETSKFRRYIRGSHYETLCMTLRLDRKSVYLVQTYNIKKCLVMQSISLPMTYNEHYTFVGTMDIGLTVIKMPPYSAEGKITAGITGEGILVALNLHAHILNISSLNKSWEASYLEISTVHLIISNINHSQAMYIQLHVDVANTTTDCINSIDKRNVISATNHNTSGIIEPSNMCGLLQYSIPFVYAFNFVLHAGLWHDNSIFIYMHVHTWCTTNKTVNTFTVVAQTATIFHSVFMTKELYVLNQVYQPIAVIYQNNIGCTFQIEYRARMYSISAYIGLDSGSLQSYMKVRWPIRFSKILFFVNLKKKFKYN